MNPLELFNYKTKIIMNLKLILGITFVTAVLFTSCKKGKLVTEQPIPAIYNLSQLNASAKFADKTITKDENRTFSIGLKDGTHLNFNLNGVAQTVFGKIRTLVGTVEINKVKEKALILVGENGFSLYYQHDNHLFAIKDKENLELGYKQPSLDLTSDVSKKEMAEYTKTNGAAATKKLVATYNNFKNSPVMVEENYNVVTEASNGYSLVDMTLTEQKKQSIEGKKMSVGGLCKPPTSGSSSRVANSMSQQVSKRYNLEIAYMENNFKFTTQYAWLAFSFVSIERKSIFNPTFWLPSVSQTNIGTSFTDIGIFLAYIYPTSMGMDQLNHLTAYNLTANHGVPAGSCRIALYKKAWKENTGVAWSNSYLFYFNSPGYSTAVSCDATSNNFLAILCAENLGALPVTNNALDVMYSLGDNYDHYDADNLKAIRANFGL